MTNVTDLIQKLDDLQKECELQENRNKLGKIRRNISSLKEMLDRLIDFSDILQSEREVDWYYDKFKEEKKKLKR